MVFLLLRASNHVDQSLVPGAPSALHFPFDSASNHHAGTTWHEHPHAPAGGLRWSDIKRLGSTGRGPDTNRSAKLAGLDIDREPRQLSAPPPGSPARILATSDLRREPAPRQIQIIALASLRDAPVPATYRPFVGLQIAQGLLVEIQRLGKPSHDVLRSSSYVRQASKSIRTSKLRFCGSSSSTNAILRTIG